MMGDAGRRSLRNELASTLSEIDLQIAAVYKDSESDDYAGVPASQLKSADGNYLLTPLLVAKAQVLYSLVLMESSKTTAVLENPTKKKR
jgi:hypothetical protein